LLFVDPNWFLIDQLPSSIQHPKDGLSAGVLIGRSIGEHWRAEFYTYTYGVVLLEGGDEKVGSGLANILDAKVINDESKHDWSGGVEKETGCMAGLNKTSGGELAHELLVGEKGDLGKVIHSAINLDVDKTFAGKRGEIILVYDALGKGGEWDSSNSARSILEVERKKSLVSRVRKRVPGVVTTLLNNSLEVGSSAVLEETSSG